MNDIRDTPDGTMTLRFPQLTPSCSPQLW
ncbi:hypothetical protein AZE42_10541 [Rhizopogon vesiculosus]|uniref:Uncharacterized protein n=1 Tax=Rhizopogon vesiculosus TaxID=180088 RepID=A0A1J8QJC6_9AGAM|nr:hypothetical protein AZE42_10541 [Rhizopogon vesiculosus]